jgi:hypothetical protein
MATYGCDRQTLLQIFADNNTNNISAADMRTFVNCVYDNFLELTKVIDNLDTYSSNSALSANQGAILNDKIEQNQQDIVNLDSNKIDKTEVYDKSESDSRYYTQNYIDSNFYDTSNTYSKAEIDQVLQNIQQAIIDLSNRVDCIVTKNNLIDC